MIDAILEEDQTKPAKQRHTAQRILDRLRVVTRKFQGVEDGGQEAVETQPFREATSGFQRVAPAVRRLGQVILRT